MAEPDMAVFLAHCGFMDIKLLPASSQSLSAFAFCCFNDRPPYNQLYSAAVPLSSLVNTDIHQYPISFSWSRPLYPLGPLQPPHPLKRKKKTLLLLLFQSPIFIVTKHALFWAQTLQEKLILEDHCHRRCHGYSHTRWWLDSLCVIAGSIPGSQRQCDINDSDVPPVSFTGRDIKAMLGEKKVAACFEKKIRIQFVHSLSAKKLLLRDASRHAYCVTWDACEEEWDVEGPDRGGRLGGGGHLLTSVARQEVSHRLLPGQGQCPL